MNDIQNKLVEIIQDRTPVGFNAASLLMDILSISKEAAYRRLSRKIDFTFEEVIKLAKKLDISLDSLLFKNSSSAALDVTRGFDPDKKNNHFDDYRILLENIISSLKKIKENTNPKVISISTSLLAYAYSYTYESFTKLRIIRFFYLKNNHIKNIKFSEIVIPDRIRQLEQELFDELMQVNQSYIVGNGFFVQYKKDIDQYYNLGMITKKDIEIIKKDFTAFFSQLDRDIANGKTMYGANLDLYVSNLKYAYNFVSFSSQDYEMVTASLFGYNIYNFKDQYSINETKNWILYLIKSSTLISLSGAKSRIDFIQKQNEIISSF